MNRGSDLLPMNTLSPFFTQPMFPSRCAAAPDASDFMSGRTLRDLRDQLQVVQKRLGTSAEQASDFEHARHLAHEINNRMTLEYLHAVVMHADADLINAPHPVGPQLLVA